MAHLDASFQNILRKLCEKRGLDFSEYRLSFLQRRMESRLQVFNVSDFAGYERVLDAHPEELNELFNALTINVAEFFRDPRVWDFIKSEIFPSLLRKDKPLRLWSAGCACGEEPYTIAMILKEMTRRIPYSFPIKILATDVDPLAIVRAMDGTYGQSSLHKVPQKYLDTYFRRGNQKGTETYYSVVPEIKSMVKLAKHNYLGPSALDRADAIFCRNSMIYLNADARERAVTEFYKALNPEGYLVLGSTEVLIGEAHSKRFQTLRQVPGIFQKLPS